MACGPTDCQSDADGGPGHEHGAGRDTNTGTKRARETRAALGPHEAVAVPCVLTAAERDLGLPVVIAVDG